MEDKSLDQFSVMQAHIVACKASGKPVVEYCQQHQIKVHQYYYWQKKIQMLQEPGRFIRIAQPLSVGPVSIVFTNGNRLCFETMPPVDYVKQLMS